MADPRYGGRPIYYSDVLVRRDSIYGSFADLRGATWAYNDDTSHSGYNLMRYHLGRLGYGPGFFGRVVASGFHETSLRMLLDGAVDISAIDSTVLDLFREREPLFASRLRVVQVLGPSPMPPWVVSRVVPPALRFALRQTLLAMHWDPEGKEILERGRLARFAAVTDRHYDPVRVMARVAEQLSL